MTISTKPAILDRMQVLSDPLRSRLLALLDGRELTVSELCDVLQAPQSTVSRHLRVLADDGWIAARREGTNRHYTMSRRRPRRRCDRPLGPGAPARGRRAGRRAGRAKIAERSRVASRAVASEFFDRSAGEWDQLRVQLFGAQRRAVG